MRYSALRRFNDEKMTRTLALGNGNLLVSLDHFNSIRDLYYPYVGQENHVIGHAHKTGIWVEGELSWILHDSDWEGTVGYEKDTLVSKVHAQNARLQLAVTVNECVHPHNDIILRRICITNTHDEARECKLFVNQHFDIFESNVGDTVYYQPQNHSIVTYKGKRYFLINGSNGDEQFDDFATGEADVGGKIGTHADAIDGELSNHPIEHGSVDSTIGFTVQLAPGESHTIYYWIAVGKNYNSVCELNDMVMRRHPDKLIQETELHWWNWCHRQECDFMGLNHKIVDLFRRSLLIIQTQTDNRGAILAANDTDTFHFKRDTYSYMWPRDGALVARSLDKCGYKEMTKQFFQFCADVITDEGFLLHKYRPDRSLGSSWHSWLKHSRLQLPIQEDETALVLHALWNWYQEYKDDAFIEELYDTLIRPAAEFMTRYRDTATGLPDETYDLWEEKLGIHTFTCCTVYGGLWAARQFAYIFGNETEAKKYERTAEEIKEAMIAYLYDEEREAFVKCMYYDREGERQYDRTIDVSSGFGLFKFQVLSPDDWRVERTMNRITKTLWCDTPIAGMARYEGDEYHRVTDDVPGNPWFITTLWLAQYHIARAQSYTDLEPAVDLLEWAVRHTMESGVMSEQLDPYDGSPLSVSPLTWSHATFVTTVISYLDALEHLNICTPYECNSARQRSILPFQGRNTQEQQQREEIKHAIQQNK